MYGPTILTSLLPLFSLTLATPLKRQDAPEFNITSLKATFPYPGTYGVPSVYSFVEIAVTWPDLTSDDGAALSTTCKVDWAAGVEPGPTDWKPCTYPFLQFRLSPDGWTSTTEFRVELWARLTLEGTGLDASHILKSFPSNPSDPDTYLFCLQMGKFNPLTCTLTGPMGEALRTVVMPGIEMNERPN